MSLNECRYFRRSNWQDEFLNRIEEDGPWANWELYKLAIEVENHYVIPILKDYKHQNIYPI